MINGTELVINNEMVDGADNVQHMAVDQVPLQDQAMGYPGAFVGPRATKWPLAEFVVDWFTVCLYSSSKQLCCLFVLLTYIMQSSRPFA